MPINLDLYRIFLTVADNRSFSKAARALYISQPAVSQSIAQLESRLACPLFVRTPRGVELTEEGSALYQYISKAMGFVTSGEEHLSSLRGLRRGSLRIGAGDTISHHFLLPHLRCFHEQYPEIQIEVTNRTSSETLDLLRTGRVDIGLINLPVDDDPALHFTPCADIHDVFVASEDVFGHLKGKTLTLKEIAALPLILLEEAANSRRYVDRFFSQQGIALTPEIELGAHALLLEFAQIGLGIACVTQEFAGQALENGRLFVLEQKTAIPEREIGLAVREGVPVPRAAQTFMDMIV